MEPEPRHRGGDGLRLRRSVAVRRNADVVDGYRSQQGVLVSEMLNLYFVMRSNLSVTYIFNLSKLNALQSPIIRNQ